MEELFKRYGYAPDKERISKSLDAIASDIDSVLSPEVLRSCLSFQDLTTLHTEDTPASVAKFVERVNSFVTDYPSYPLPASVCVFSNFASLVKKSLKSPEVRVTTVSACFPTSQSFLEVKARECELAVEYGADEIDIVLPLNAFLEGDFDTVCDEIGTLRDVVDGTAEDSDAKPSSKLFSRPDCL